MAPPAVPVDLMALEANWWGSNEGGRQDVRMIGTVSLNTSWPRESELLLCGHCSGGSTFTHTRVKKELNSQFSFPPHQAESQQGGQRRCEWRERERRMNNQHL